jgi:excisionase family DNA binding protein
MTRDKKEVRKYLTTTQAARIAHLSPSTLLRAVQGKKLRAFSTPGGHFRIDPASLEAFLKSSGVQEGGKKKIWLVRLSSSEGRKLLDKLAGDNDFSMTDDPAPGERPCVILVDASSTGKKKVSLTDLHDTLRRWCGTN